MKRKLQEAGKVLAVCTAFLIGFVCLFMIPDDSHEIGKWTLLLLGSKGIAVAGFYTAHRLWKRWENAGWLKRYKEWVEEADRMPNPLNNGDRE